MLTSSAHRLLLPTAPILALALGTGCRTENANPTGVDALAPKVAAVTPEPAAPSARMGHGDFFPLQQGNRWEHARHFQAWIIPDEGEPPDPVTVEARIVSQIAGSETRHGLIYDIMERQWNEEGNEFTQWIRMRQDPGGLYEADVFVTEPPTTGLTDLSRATPSERWSAVHRALTSQSEAEDLHPGYLEALERLLERHERILALLSGGTGGRSKASRRSDPQDDELLRLAYPLRPGTTWTVLQDPLGTATVEGREVLELPSGKAAAWRIRWEWEFLEAGDRVVTWYGRCGMLKLEAHTEGVATDPGGEPIGRLIGDESETLVDLDVQRGGCR